MNEKLKGCKDESSNLVKNPEDESQSPDGIPKKKDNLNQDDKGKFTEIDIGEYIKGRVLKKIEFFNCLKNREKIIIEIISI